MKAPKVGTQEITGYTKNKIAINVCSPGYWDFEHVGNALSDNK
jgi:hypothetical protein